MIKTKSLNDLIALTEDLFTLSVEDIKYIHYTDSVYSVKEFVEFMYSHMIDIIDITILSEERLDEIIFSTNCLLNHLFNLTITEEMEAIYNLTMMKLNDIKEFCVNNELYEVAQNIKNFQNLFVKNYHRLND